MFCIGSAVAPAYRSPERQPVQWTQFPLCWLCWRAQGRDSLEMGAWVQWVEEPLTPVPHRPQPCTLG